MGVERKNLQNFFGPFGAIHFHLFSAQVVANSLVLLIIGGFTYARRPLPNAFKVSHAARCAPPAHAGEIPPPNPADARRPLALGIVWAKSWTAKINNR